MVTRLKNVAPLQFAATAAVLYAILGLIGALLWLPFAALMGATGQAAAAHALGFGIGIAAIVVFPLVYGCIGFVGGLITSLIYNLVASITGGIEVTLETSVSANVPAGGYTA